MILSEHDCKNYTLDIQNMLFPRHSILTPFSNKQIEVKVYLEEYFIQFDEVLRIKNNLISC